MDHRFKLNEEESEDIERVRASENTVVQWILGSDRVEGLLEFTG